MKRFGFLYSILLLVSVVISGCATTTKTQPAQSLSKDQAIVFGKVNVTVNGKHIKMSPSGFTSYLTIEFRQKGSSTIEEYAIGETGYFYWALAPGEYEILGIYGFADVGFFDMKVPLVKRVWIPFTAKPEVESLYLGDLTVEFSKNRYTKQRLKDNYSEAIREFRKKFPSARTEPLNKVAKLSPPDPGTYLRVRGICSGNWGINCSSGNIGVTPTSPNRLQNVVVESTAPTLRWAPSFIRTVKYDVAIYEAYDSNWRKINLDLLTGTKRWRPGRLVIYAQGLTTPTFKLDFSLRPNTTYLWSVRLRRGDTVSTWSQVKHTIVHPGAFLFFGIEQWETWLNFTTPSK